MHTHFLNNPETGADTALVHTVIYLWLQNLINKKKCTF